MGFRLDFGGSTAYGARKSKRAALPRPPVGYYPHDVRALESISEDGEERGGVKGGAERRKGLTGNSSMAR